MDTDANDAFLHLVLRQATLRRRRRTSEPAFWGSYRSDDLCATAACEPRPTSLGNLRSPRLGCYSSSSLCWEDISALKQPVDLMGVGVSPLGHSKPSNSPEPNVRQRRAQERLARQLGDVGFALPGSVIERRTTCGKAGCRCTADPPELHGPYIQWTRKVDGRTVTKVLSPEQRGALSGVVRQRPPPPEAHRRTRSPLTPHHRGRRELAADLTDHHATTTGELERASARRSATDTEPAWAFGARMAGTVPSIR